jgi:hypothetical protein
MSAYLCVFLRVFVHAYIEFGGLCDGLQVAGNGDAGLDENGHYTLVLVRHGEI